MLDVLSTVKVALYAEVMRQSRLGLVDLDAAVSTRPGDLTGGSGVVALLRPRAALSEGEEFLGRLGAIVFARWWPGPGPVPVRPGWLSGRLRPHDVLPAER